MPEAGVLLESLVAGLLDNSDQVSADALEPEPLFSMMGVLNGLTVSCKVAGDWLSAIHGLAIPFVGISGEYLLRAFLQSNGSTLNYLQAMVELMGCLGHSASTMTVSILLALVGRRFDGLLDQMSMSRVVVLLRLVELVYECLRNSLTNTPLCQLFDTLRPFFTQAAADSCLVAGTR